MSHTVLRRADISDAARILEIYTPYITDTNITNRGVKPLPLGMGI